LGRKSLQVGKILAIATAQKIQGIARFDRSRAAHRSQELGQKYIECTSLDKRAARYDERFSQILRSEKISRPVSSLKSSSMMNLPMVGMH